MQLMQDEASLSFSLSRFLLFSLSLLPPLYLPISLSLSLSSSLSPVASLILFFLSLLSLSLSRSALSYLDLSLSLSRRKMVLWYHHSAKVYFGKYSSKIKDHAR